MNIKSKLSQGCIMPLLFLLLSHVSFSQVQDSTQVKPQSFFSGNIVVTNNGMSLIPSFTLGKPALLFELSIGKNKLSFDPLIRFALDGKPWSFVFWWRYKVLTEGKFRLHVGAHPAINFRTIPVSINNETRDIQQVRRYLATEVAPSIMISKNFSLGMYYLYSRGLEEDATKTTHFVTVNGSISQIKITKDVFLKVAPQLFYLMLDNEDGFFSNATLTLTKQNYPFSVSSVLNKSITSNISSSKSFVWNISLLYSFNQKYLRRG